MRPTVGSFCIVFPILLLPQCTRPWATVHSLQFLLLQGRDLAQFQLYAPPLVFGALGQKARPT